MKGYREEDRSVIITIPVGSSEKEETISDLPKGSKVYMGVVAKPEQPGLVRLAIDRNGDTIVKAKDVSWFDGKLGSFHQRAMAIADKGGSRLRVYAKTQVPVATQDLQIEVTFVVLVPDSSCEI